MSYSICSSKNEINETGLSMGQVLWRPGVVMLHNEYLMWCELPSAAAYTVVSEGKVIKTDFICLTLAANRRFFSCFVEAQC